MNCPRCQGELASGAIACPSCGFSFDDATQPLNKPSALSAKFADKRSLTSLDSSDDPITTELGAWYAIDFVMAAAFLVAIAALGCYTNMAGQRVFSGKLLED